MSRDTLSVYSERNMMMQDRDVMLILTARDGSRRKIAFAFENMEDTGFVTRPTIDSGSSIEGVSGTDFLQTVLNHAWEAGLRPVGFNDVPQQVAALREHLHDMRALVFKDKVRPRE